LLDFIDSAVKRRVAGVNAGLQEGGAFLFLFGEAGGELAELGEIQVDDGVGADAVLVLTAR
jgi:hypothetical protein